MGKNTQPNELTLHINLPKMPAIGQNRLEEISGDISDP